MGPGREALPHPQFTRLEPVLVLLVTPPEVDQPHRVPGRRLGGPQVHHQARRVVVELRVVGGEPGREDGPRARPEVRGHGTLPGVQHAEHSGEVLLAQPEQIVHQGHYPGPGEPVHASGPAVLGGLPLHEPVQHLRVPLIEDEPHLADIARQAPLLLQRRLGLTRVSGPQPGRIVAVARLQVNHRRGEHPGDVASERLLFLHEMVELEAGEPAAAQQFLGVPEDPGPVHQGLAVGEPEADRPADAQEIALVR